jgi:PPOX class probable F420-dependent enzyme
MGTNLRANIALSRMELDAMLRRTRTLYVATLNGDGSPHLVPMYFVVLTGVVTFWSYRKSQKIVNLRRNPRISCLVEEGSHSAEVRAAQISGTGIIDVDPTFVTSVGRALHEKYVGPLSENDVLGIERNGAKRVAVRVSQEQIASWDHRKLGRMPGLD